MMGMEPCKVLRYLCSQKKSVVIGGTFSYKGLTLFMALFRRNEHEIEFSFPQKGGKSSQGNNNNLLTLDIDTAERDESLVLQATRKKFHLCVSLIQSVVWR